MNQADRFYFQDNLRAFIILLVVVLHGSLTYMVNAPSWWYVVDSQKSLLFTVLVVLIDVPIMLIMFFLAGYFALPSLARRGFAGFIREKLVRIGAPWLFGVLVLTPPTAYMIYYSRGVPMTLLQFWSTDFWTVAYQQSVYWFLGVLLLFFILLSLIHRGSKRLQNVRQQIAMPTGKLFVAFGASMTLCMFLMNRFFPLDAWHTRSYILVFQPLRMPLYIGYFCLGIYAYARGWFSHDGYRPHLGRWAVVWLISGLLYLADRLVVLPAFPSPTAAVQLLHAALFNTFCFSSLMAGMALFQRKVNAHNAFWRSLGTTSYAIYYIHPLVLYPLAYVFVAVSMPLFIKAPVVILTGIFLSWLVSALVLTRVPVVRRAFS